MKSRILGDNLILAPLSNVSFTERIVSTSVIDISQPYRIFRATVAVFGYSTFSTPVTRGAFTRHGRYPPASSEPVTLFLWYLESRTLSRRANTLQFRGPAPRRRRRGPHKTGSVRSRGLRGPRAAKPLKSRATSVYRRSIFFHLATKISTEIGAFLSSSSSFFFALPPSSSTSRESPKAPEIKNPGVDEPRRKSLD